ncbi:hypothetical protein CFD26_107054 [Aspergillus turcosus]|uniref:Zn(2)-C6 fungal-type domain-containing protein n=1 Tax=Aspergillus turcosus TaxID=1245748 RepID=A0A421DDH8_9EURO|nr:hypothetical protein CFD26_107054 [Aspergillus turcosus]
MTDLTPGPHVQNAQNPGMTREKKRTRVQLSCTACRSRRLKCCRIYPCTNCKKRGEAASCTYVGRGPRGRSSQGRASPTLVQDRLQHLENLILSFTQKKSSEQSQSSSASEQQNTLSTTAGDVVQPVLEKPSSGMEPESRGSAPESTGRLLDNEAGSSYFDGAHWVNEVKGYLQQEADEESEEEVMDDNFFDSSSPALLLGLNKPASKEELLADIHPRPVADRLVSQFLHSKEPLLVVIHFPTFQKEAWQPDVEPPRNLFDEDFDKNTQELPPSQPETELTTLCYTRAKGRVMSIFGRISDLAYSREPVTYKQTLEIDRHLEEAHDQIPSIIRLRPMEQSITDPSDLILKRFTLEILYQKCRCVLHRRYLAEFHDNMRYAYSRWVCMTAAKQILQHQAVLHYESQPGGQLYRERRFPNSIQNTDYLLAAMIICLELSRGRPTEPQTNSQSNDMRMIIKGREDLLAVLETTHQIFKDMRRRSADAQKAYAAMSIMLRRVKKSMEHAVDSTGSSSGQEFNTTSDVSPPPYDGWQNREGPSSVLAHDQINAMQSPFGSLGVIEEMFDAPTNLDWRLWDQQIQGFEDANARTFWYPGLES